MEITYINYQKIYGGNIIPNNSFKKYSSNASSRIAYFTSNRVSKVENAEILLNVFSATCEIAELLYNQDQLIAKQNDDTSTKASETVGPHSVSYVNKSNLQSQRIMKSNELEQECYKICSRYLAKYGLMYRGR
ncbi:MAG: hypothetical protein IJ568_05705 [Bacilli bacterium]|nr:hypothetical protein [Bacilli bacterium]